MLPWSSNKNIENNPMQSSRQGPAQPADIPKPFDPSGKSPAQWHHPRGWIGSDVVSLARSHSLI
jgi:hypothetical protein